MNSYGVEVRRRRQNLLIVEGEHEKNQLFWLIFKCFPEIDINMEDVWVYGTNIYMLYEDIQDEYGENWIDEDMDVDLPLVISNKQKLNTKCYRDNFINIILVFDFERHDPKFSEEVILNMQTYFNDATDVGKLYINYPMIESYQHISRIPDNDYQHRKIPVTLQPGSMYKELVRNETTIGPLVRLPYQIDGLLEKKFHVADSKIRKDCCNQILDIFQEDKAREIIFGILNGVVDSSKLENTTNQLFHWIRGKGYWEKKKSYWGYMRSIFQEIIAHNICKAGKIQDKNFVVEVQNKVQCKEYVESIDFVKILNIQNQVSRDKENGFIWVLNTSTLYVMDYNTQLLLS